MGVLGACPTASATTCHVFIGGSYRLSGYAVRGDAGAGGGTGGSERGGEVGGGEGRQMTQRRPS